MKLGQMMLVSPGLYEPEQNRLFLAISSSNTPGEDGFCSGDSYPPETSII
jgi:hypothetical protein